MDVSLESYIDFNDAKGQLPLEFARQKIYSNDLDIEGRVQREVIPREQSSFGHQTLAGVASGDTLNNRLTFYVSDPKHYLDLMNSYFTCDFRAVACLNNAGVNGNALESFLDVGGIHSLIKTLTIKIGGAVLMRLDDYNKWYNLNNLVTHSEAYTDFMLQGCGDSVEDLSNVTPLAPVVNTPLTFVGNGVTLTAGGLLTLVDGAAIAELAVGDIIRIRGTAVAAATDQVARVLSITSNNVVQLTGGNIAITGADADNRVSTIIIVHKNSTLRSTRAALMNGGALPGQAVAAGSQKLVWQLPVGCLRFMKYFPLPYIQDVGPLEIEFEWVEAPLGITLNRLADVAAANRLGYQVSKPRFMVNLVEPSKKVRDMHDMAYNSEGLWLHYVNYRHFRNRLDNEATDAVFTFQTNLSSVRHAFTVLVDAIRADSTDATAQNFKSQSSFEKSSLTQYRYQAGSQQFPDYGNVQCATTFAGEAWAQLMMAFNIKGNTYQVSRIKPQEWRSNTGTKFIVSTTMSKDESPFTGLSLKNNFLELNLVKTAEARVFNAHSYLGYDCALSISRAKQVRVWD